MQKQREASLNQVVIEAIKKLLKDADMSPAQLSRSSGVGENEISRLLTGRTKNPPLDVLDDIAKVFQKRIFDLFDEVPRTLELRDDEVALLAAWNAVRYEAGRAGILALIRGQKARETSAGRGERAGARKPSGKTADPQ